MADESEVLRADINWQTKSVRLMDNFSRPRFKYMFVKDRIYFETLLEPDQNFFYCHLLISKFSNPALHTKGTEFYQGPISMTQLKSPSQEFSRLQYFIGTQLLTKNIVEEYQESRKLFVFDTLYLFKAQNSNDLSRRNSGYRWNDSGLKHSTGGKPYGYATPYAIVGVFCADIPDISSIESQLELVYPKTKYN